MTVTTRYAMAITQADVTVDVTGGGVADPGVYTLSLTNSGPDRTSVSIAITAGGTPSEADWIEWRAPMSASDVLSRWPVPLSAGWCVWVRASAAGLTAILTGMADPDASALPAIPETHLSSVQRFDPRHWTVDGPLTSSFSLTTQGGGLLMSATLRRRSDMVGVLWSSRDKFGGPALQYLTQTNWRECCLDFMLSVNGLAPVEDVHGLTMTVTDTDGAAHHIRLAAYIVAGGAFAARVRLDFTGSETGVPVMAGYDQSAEIPWGSVEQIAINIAPPAYDPTDTTPLDTPMDVELRLTDITVTGSNSRITLSTTTVPPHALRMTDGYDDGYNLTPERIVDGIWALGYRDWYVLYIGATHLHDLAWDEAQGHFVVKGAVSTPSRRWFGDLFRRLHARGYRIVVSQSYEVFAEFCPDGWRQRDRDGNPARTGWEPPSTLISPTSGPAMQYLADVQDWMLDAAAEVGAVLYYQIGEPWWWDGSYGGSGPCFYDASTTTLYTAETGLPVPEPRIGSVTAEIGQHEHYLRWLGDKLGESTLWLRDHARARHPAVTVMALIFTPQILNPTAPMLTLTNLPVAHWRYPAYDIVQLEDYDWVTERRWELHETSITAGTEILGYPLERLHYFSGFNLLPKDAADNWPSIHRAAEDGFGWGVAETFVWARPQVWRDGWLWPSGELLAPLADDPDPGPPQIERQRPRDLQAVATSWGDIMLSWTIDGDAARRYSIEIMDPANESAIVRVIKVDAPRIVDGRVVVDYPVEMSVPDFGFPPTWLHWRVRGDYVLAATIAGDIPVDNAKIVKRAIMFSGQSNAVGHFTELSGNNRDDVSAATLRRKVADLTGLRDVEVMPVNAAWGSAAADKWADDDPVDGVNHWWDVDADAPGPRALEAVKIARELGVPITALIWAQGENDASAFDPQAAPRHSSPERYRAATEHIFAYIRDQLDQPDLPIWIQTLGRSYWGNDPNTLIDASGSRFKAARDQQRLIANADPNTMIGSWLPGADRLSGYVPEAASPGWIHYTAAVYHAAAIELAESIVNGIDRTDTPPLWTISDAPTGMRLIRVASDDIVVTWDAVPGATWRVRNISISDAGIISDTTVDNPQYIFTVDEQMRAYGHIAGYINLEIAQKIDGALGPSATYVVKVDEAGSGPTGLTATALSLGDIIYAWDASAGTHVWLQNIDVGSGTVIWEGPIEGRSYRFTAAAQTAHYGYTTALVRWRVRAYDPQTGAVGPAAEFAGEAAAGLDPSTVRLLAATEEPPDAARIDLIDRTIQRLKVAGEWPRLTRLYDGTAHTEQASTLNWINPDFAPLQKVAGAVHTPGLGWSSPVAGARMESAPLSLSEGVAPDNLRVAVFLSAAPGTAIASGWRYPWFAGWERLLYVTYASGVRVWAIRGGSAAADKTLQIKPPTSPLFISSTSGLVLSASDGQAAQSLTLSAPAAALSPTQKLCVVYTSDIAHGAGMTVGMLAVGRSGAVADTPLRSIIADYMAEVGVPA